MLGTMFSYKKYDRLLGILIINTNGVEYTSLILFKAYSLFVFQEKVIL